MKKLEGKVAVVTGASKGIGASIAKHLAAEGASVVVNYASSKEGADRVVDEIAKRGGTALAVQANVAKKTDIERLFAGTKKAFGRLDILVNNAGTAIPKKFEEATLEEMDRVIDINVRGVFVATQAALKHMRDGGRIIMIGSSVGERNMMPGLVPYAATKGAVKMFTQGLA